MEIVIDEDTTISMGNHKMEEITGYTDEEIERGIKWTEVVVPEDKERLLQFHYKRRESPDDAPTEYEFRIKDRRGEFRDMFANVAMLPSSNNRSLVSLVDISGLKRTERALRESEKKYRGLFENANDIIFTLDLEGNFTSANKAALQTYGYSENDFFGTSFHQIIDPEYIPLVAEKLSDKLSIHEKSHTYEVLTRTRDGKPVWVEVSTRLIREKDQSVGIQGIARDISERKCNEEQLLESRLRFKETADLLPGIICEMDTSLRLTYVNEIGLTTFGYTFKEFQKGIFAYDLVAPEFKEKFKSNTKKILSGGSGSSEIYTLLKKDKLPIHVFLNSAPILKKDEVVGVRTCFFDISDRLAAEEKLRLSEERFRSIYAESPVGIALFSPEGFLIDMNRSFQNMFEINGDVQIELFKALGFGSREMDSLAGGDVVNREIKQGSRFFDWYITPLSHPETGVSIYLVQVQDITERREVQEAKLQKERDATAKAEALVAGLKRELREKASFHNMVSRSPQMQQIFDTIPQIAQASATALITGDSGTGKELVARSLHELSNRKSKPFVAINCSALPDNLLESELFGYKAGAFTDAKKDKPGKFALAEGGTIFLDEIGDISPAMQVKLLRVLQERVFEPLGGTSPVKANVRVIVATNKNLADMVRNGEFREDLFYRINVVTIKLPPLRDRRCDIQLLAEHFIGLFNDRYCRSIMGIDSEAMDLLLSYDFPGNIRELENIIEHAFIFCKEPMVGIGHLPSNLCSGLAIKELNTLAQVKSFDDLERLYIKSVLEENGGSKIKTAQKLGIHKATLFRKLKQLGM